MTINNILDYVKIPELDYINKTKLRLGYNKEFLERAYLTHILEKDHF